jgi:hypothetical protein
MFDVTQPTKQPDDQAEGPAQAGVQPIGGQLLQRLVDAEGQRIYLPRGSAQSGCEPQSYYYLASDSGAVPSWVVDEVCRRRRRNGAN